MRAIRICFRKSVKNARLKQTKTYVFRTTRLLAPASSVIYGRHAHSARHMPYGRGGRCGRPTSPFMAACVINVHDDSETRRVTDVQMEDVEKSINSCLSRSITINRRIRQRTELENCGGLKIWGKKQHSA